MQAVFLDYASLGPDALNDAGLRDLLPGLECYDSTTPDELLARIGEAELLIVNKVMLDRIALQHARKLRLIAVTATGTNNVDLDAARACGIRVCHARDYGTASVVQHTFCLMLALANRLPAYMQDVQSGVWSHQKNFCLLHHPMMELSGKTLGVIGYGVLGQGVAGMARRWGMRILVASLPGRQYPSQGDVTRVSLQELLQHSDVVSVHCLLSDSTQGLLGRTELASMKPGALLINVARGGIIDEAALLEALRSGHLGGAATDVLAEEPPCAQDPMLTGSLPNLIVTPHCAWATVESRQRLLDQVVQNLRAFIATGEPVHAVC